MYYLDTQSGGRRRALVRDRVVSAGHHAAGRAQAQARRALDRAKGVLATRSLHRVSRRAPESDQQLHDRIRARLGRVISHPKALAVMVDQGCVRLSGHVLRHEVEPLLAELQAMPGVHEVRNEADVHDTPEGVPSLQGHTSPSGREKMEPSVH
jgi:osmotically-inducible protein OsmY